ncbi:MAG: LamG domain-containing protein [Alphaproteobacteria bacterium]|nr:LamG domain-containing protein [Alphaproteobacteria bacterium]
MREFFVRLRHFRSALVVFAAVLVVSIGASAVFAAAENDTGVKDGLLFYLSADKGFTADFAKGDPKPNYDDKTTIANDPKTGPYIRSEGEQVLSWHAASNVYAQRGTLDFNWRAREALGGMQFPLFRVGYFDHTSWNMDWLRIDWNGHGIDAYVTDNNLAEVRVSYRMDKVPAADQWVNIGFTWDETKGVCLYVDGKLVAQKDATAVLDSGLDQFGPFSRTISPMQVQSGYQYVRGGDIDEIRFYDHMLSADSVADVAQGKPPVEGDVTPVRDLGQAQWNDEWAMRYGFNRPNDPPTYLSSPDTTIRKVEIPAAWDLKERMMGATDGIRETTWPGVYNRSRLPGRHDYFELPDWNVYVQGGKSITFDLPDEPWNHIEFTGAAYGKITYIPKTGAETLLATRPEGQERTYYQFAEQRTGGKIRFDNVAQETPIQEFEVYNVVPGSEPKDEQKLSYTVNTDANPAYYPDVHALRKFIHGRYVKDERSTVVALPVGAPMEARKSLPSHTMPIVHVLIPADFRTGPAGGGGPVGHFSYGWENMDVGLDGIAIDIPALNVKPTMGAYFPLNIQIKDPIWPGRNLLDVNVSVKPGEARTVWLDTRDRLLPNDVSLYLTIAGGGQDFNASSLNGMHVRLVFKPRAAALPEHIADRLAQIRDNVAFIVEEHTNDKRLSRFERLERDFASLFAADPNNKLGRLYWDELNPEQGWPAFTQPVPPKGVPLWAFRQTQDLKLVRQFIEWWIDNRQVPYGDFGGGISDDVDLLEQWPGLVQMGDIPDKATHSLDALADAIDKNHMITNGVGTILTDYLHSYEEGINTRSEDAYVNWGDPKVFERLMQTGRYYPNIIKTNKTGHTDIITQLFSGTRVVTEGPWGWEHPYSYLILHPAIMLVNFNDNPQLKALILKIADSYISYGKQQADGTWCFPEFFNSQTDATEGCLKPHTRGLMAVSQLFWAAYEWTGDKKYLAPLYSVLDQGDHFDLRYLNANVLGQLGKTDTWGKQILEHVEALEGTKAGESRPFSPARDDGAMPINTQRYIAWLVSGDKKYLEDLYADEIQTDTQRMYMVTEGHWWSDRVELFSDLLQRTRMGGLTLRRNQTFQGNLVSWRFAGAPTEAESVGILIHDPMPTKFGVEAYNLSSKPIKAKMTGWMIAPGTWKMSGKGIKTQTFTFERSTSVDLTFSPHQTTMVNFELVTPEALPQDRPDIGIGSDDVKVAGDTIDVTVHSLGSVEAPAGTATLLNAKGETLSSVAIPSIAAPVDLEPKTVKVDLPMKTGGVLVRVALDNGVKEITQLNNEVSLKPETASGEPVKPVKRSKTRRKM